MEAVTVTNNPSINLLVDDTDDTNNPVLEVQISATNQERIVQQIVLYSEFELKQAEEIHKLIVFHSPRDPNRKIDWLEKLDDDAFASADHDPYGRSPYKQEPSKPVFGPEPPPKYPVPKEYYSRNEEEYDDLDFQEQLAREFEEQEKDNKQRS